MQSSSFSNDVLKLHMRILVLLLLLAIFFQLIISTENTFAYLCTMCLCSSTVQSMKAWLLVFKQSVLRLWGRLLSTMLWCEHSYIGLFQLELRKFGVVCSFIIWIIHLGTNLTYCLFLFFHFALSNVNSHFSYSPRS